MEERKLVSGGGVNLEFSPLSLRVPTAQEIPDGVVYMSEWQSENGEVSSSCDYLIVTTGVQHCCAFSEYRFLTSTFLSSQPDRYRY